MEPVIVRRPLGDNSPEAKLYYGQHVLDTLKELPSNIAQTVCTSPPYWQLRNYGLPDQDWGDWKGQLGLEPTPDLYVEHLVQVFREVRRVLRPDGVVWLNLGDSYLSHPAQDISGLGGFTGDRVRQDKGLHDSFALDYRTSPVQFGLKDKDLVGIPWRVAFALQADGWWLRNAIVWHKKNPMPSPIQDRMTCSYEHVFLLTPAAHYYFDLDAIRVPYVYGTYEPSGQFRPAQNWSKSDGTRKMDNTNGAMETLAGSPRKFEKGRYHQVGKNPTDVWRFATQPYPGAHFAVFPDELPTRCILGATSEKGCCPKCGAPWQRLVQKGDEMLPQGTRRGHSKEYRDAMRMGRKTRQEGVKDVKGGGGFPSRARAYVGWQPGCDCEEQPQPCTVLDPFSGTATTGKIALQLGRHYIGIDLSLQYLPMAKSRILGMKPPKPSSDVEPNPIAELFGQE